ncbi:MAG: hypothetical protein OEZ22_13060 [Spirochaetia bacterium]|nr:hypothetical protein [Spirochaetia bacterium]
MFKISSAKFSLFLLLFSLNFFCSSEQNEIYNITDGWFYRWGDSPVDENNNPDWIKETENNNGWKPFNFPDTPPDRGKNKFVWYKVKLPKLAEKEISLFISRALFDVEIYFHGEKILNFETIDLDKEYNIKSPGWSMAPIKNYISEGTVYFRIYSPYAKFIGLKDFVSIGSKTNLFSKMLKQDFDRIAISGFLIILSFLSLFFFIWYKKNNIYLVFSLTSFFAAINTLYYSYIKQFFYFPSDVWFFTGFLSGSFLAVGICYLSEKITYGNYARVLRITWRLHLTYALITFLFMCTNYYYYTGYLIYSRAYLLTFELMLIPFILASIWKTKAIPNIKIISIGFILFLFFIFHDLFIGLQVITTSRAISYWGVFILLIAFGIAFILYFLHLKNLEDNFHKQLESAISNERNEIYSDIHDHLGSNLNDASLTLNSLMQAEKINKSVLKELHLSIKKTISTLRERLSVIHDIEKLSEDFTYGLHLILLNRYSNAGRQLQFQYDSKISETLQKQGFEKIRIELYTVAKEIATNDFKYGKKNSKWILSLEQNKYSYITLKVQSKTSFKPNKKSKGLGEKNIYRRVKDIKGTIHQKIENGVFIINIKIPLS